ncbi:MAG: LPS export ABC transporter permease LptF [Deltaproteobacteria bacterium]|nr:LPS export ABC transporter permease LptF [Deltaproteobacteria bacterium]
MKLNSIVNRYIILEILPPFFINLAFLTAIFLLAKIPDIANLIVNFNVSIYVVCMMLVYTVPSFLALTIPMSVMLAVLLTMLKMSGDNEITALKSGGFSVYFLIPPVLLFCTVGYIMTLYVELYGISWGKSSIDKMVKEVAATSADFGLKERVFNESLKDVVLYVNKIDLKKKELTDIFIEDQSRKNSITSIIAPRGSIISRPEEKIFVLKLHNGSYNTVNLDRKSVYSISHFDETEIKIDLNRSAIKGVRKKRISEWDISEYRAFIKKNKEGAVYNEVLVRYYEKFAIPFGCFVLGLLAIPLGVQSASGRKVSGTGPGIFLFLLYFTILTIGTSVGKSGNYPPILTMWMPNIVLGIITIYLYKRVGEERPVEFGAIFIKIYNLIKKSRTKA